MSRTRILITGGSGFAGRGLVAHLRARSVPLTLATRTEAGEEGDLRRIPVGSIGRETDWAGALTGVGAIVHLAGHVHIAPERASAEAGIFDEVNHHGSVRLFRAAQAAGVPLFVFLSSINVLGTETEIDRPFTDLTPPRPASPYAVSKHLAETAMRRAARVGRTALVILRSPLIVGPGVGGNLARLIALAALPVPLPLGGLRNRRTLLARDNLVAAIGAVLDAGSAAAPGTYVVGDSAAVSTSEIVSALRDGLGRPANLLPAPVRLLRPVFRGLGADGAYRRLFGGLEVDSRGFRQAFGWTDQVETIAALREAASATR